MVRFSSLLAFGASMLVCTNSSAFILAQAQVHIASLITLDRDGHQIDNAFAADLSQSGAQTAQILYGPDYLNFQTNSYRRSLTPICTSAPLVPGVELVSTACASGPTGTWTAFVSAAAAPSSVNAYAGSQWTMILQPGQSLTMTGDVAVHALNQSEALPPTYPVSQYVYADAHVIFATQLYPGSSVHLTAEAGPLSNGQPMEVTKSELFSFVTTNDQPYAVDVSINLAANPNGTNASVVPEPASWVLWLAGSLFGIFRMRLGGFGRQEGLRRDPSDLIEGTA